MSDTTIYESDFFQEMIKQLRALDTYGVQDKQTPEKLLTPYFITKAQRKEIPVVGDPNPATISRVAAFYNAISMLIEQECNLMAKPIINISHEGFGTVHILVGKLVALDRVLRDVHRFGFEDASKMKDEADKLLSVAIALIGKYPDVAGM
ncbi:NifX-associated nitrogen fixation protein [Magnetococcus sp. PR-3]|uniref:NifX-associated nitrogen fixation protein n=1 Tax=Magnetococcus sp. PR-3 TaxID=3120355 RepID=UPI002FCE0484